MPFEKVVIPKYASRDPKLASISINPRTGLSIGFATEASAQLGLRDGARFGLQIGTGDDEGKIRIIADAAGRACRKIGRGGRVITFGPSVKLGFEQADKQYVAFQAIDEATIEITLPEWSEAETDGGDANSDDDSDGAEEAAPVPARPMSTREPTGVGEVVEKMGISVDLSHDAESVSFDGDTMEVTSRQAQLCAALLRGAPSPIGTEFLKKKLIKKPSDPLADSELALLAKETAAAVSSLGLDVKAVKGVGYVLVKA